MVVRIFYCQQVYVATFVLNSQQPFLNFTRSIEMFQLFNNKANSLIDAHFLNILIIRLFISEYDVSDQSSRHSITLEIVQSVKYLIQQFTKMRTLSFKNSVNSQVFKPNQHQLIAYFCYQFDELNMKIAVSKLYIIFGSTTQLQIRFLRKIQHSCKIFPLANVRNHTSIIIHL